jgi:hypothetical protein
MGSLRWHKRRSSDRSRDFDVIFAIGKMLGQQHVEQQDSVLFACVGLLYWYWTHECQAEEEAALTMATKL